MPELVLKRKMSSVIRGWLESEPHKPLLIRGARRTGKTFVVESALEAHEAHDFVKLDFQTDAVGAAHVFSGPNDDLDAIAQRLSEYRRKPVSKEGTVLFFDEVQLNEKALNSLRFFSESGWRVIATGSLLGVATKARKLPFPSGVAQVTMHPLDFEEFLWALGEEKMADDIRAHARSFEPYIAHDAALDYFQHYLVVGGMPKVVSRWAATKDFAVAVEELDEIDGTYTADMTNPENGISGISAKRIWESLPKQLLRSSTKKFKYADVVRGGRRARLLEPLEWLEAAGIVTKNEMTRDACAPLAPYDEDEGSFFKIYVADTGLMFHKFNLAPEAFLDPQLRGALSSDFRGALAENGVMQALHSNGLKTFYWMPAAPGVRGEVDFVFQTQLGEVIPVEVKSSRNVRSKSLVKLMEEGRSPYAWCLSEHNFSSSQIAGGHERRNAPLYAAFAIG